NSVIWTSRNPGFSVPSNSEDGTLEVNHCVVQGDLQSPTAPDFVWDYDPLFIDPSNGNYQISASSPAYDSGDQAFTTESKDLIGNSRVSDTDVDMGCYESTDCSQINDACSNAISLVMDGPAIFGSNRCATNTPDEATACFVNNGNSVWYTFEAPSTGTVAVTSTWLSKFTSIFNIRHVVLSGECGDFGPLLVCDNPTPGGAGEMTEITGLTPGETYFVRVDGFNTQEGRFTIRVEELPVPPVEGVLYVDQDATGSNDGSSWENALNNWGDIEDNLNGISEVWVAEGFYLSVNSQGDGDTQLFNQDLAIYGGFDGTEGSLDDRDPFDHETIVSCDLGTPGDFSDNLSRHLSFNNQLDDSPAFYFIQDLTFEGANNQSPIIASGGQVIADRIVLRNNQPQLNGLSVNVDGSLIFTNSLFYNNILQGTQSFCSIGAGGAIEFVNCTITQNTAYNFGILNAGEVMKLSNCIVWDNTWAQANTNSTKPVVQNCIYEDADQYDDQGGNIISDPLFVNPLANDFQLDEDSPGVDLGSNAVISNTFDLAGEARIQGSAVDAGC
ncbi:MAG: hypothetical protein HRT74_14140, partial [Flavobacteriales bacterium]|nr:hypothetical protein [Flavobacteriales bacterium]